MPNTTNYNWDIPADTDLVKDGAAAMRTLGNSIDTTTKNLNPETTLGDISYRSATANTNTRLPIGTNGQILTVVGGVPAWSSESGDISEVVAGTGISGGGTSGSVTVTNSMATTIDAKGDLIVGTGDNAFARLGVGTNGHTLVADSATATGLKWAAPASSGFVGASIFDANTQVISNATNTAVTWTSETFDTNGFHSNTTNTSRMTIPTGYAGKYLVNASVRWETAASGYETRIAVVKNGSTVQQRIQLSSTTAVNSNQDITLIVDCAVNDYLEIFVEQNRGQNSTMTKSESTAGFQIQYLGA